MTDENKNSVFFLLYSEKESKVFLDKPQNQEELVIEKEKKTKKTEKYLLN